MTQSAEPYKIHVTEDVLLDVNRRLSEMRWPDDPGNEDWSYGVNASYLKSLVGYWRHEFQWRDVEQRINSFENFKTSIDGVPIHFIRSKGEGPAPIPLIITHGWPWSFWDLQKVIEPLARPSAFGGNATDSFDVIVPSLPGYGFSGPPLRAGLTFWHIADLWHRLMTEVLGYQRYATSGGDWGALVSSQLGHKYASSLHGVHLMHPMLLNQFNTSRPWDVTDRALDQGRVAPPINTKFVSHFAVQVLGPQTLAYGLTDSPVGLLAWMLERWRLWGDGNGNPEKVFTREHMIATAMIYWATGTVGSSMRAYADAARYPWQQSHNRTPVVEAPTGITFLGGENPSGVTTENRTAAFKAGPRASFFNTVYLNAHRSGGHFGYYENPSAVAHDLREMFRPMRQATLAK